MANGTKKESTRFVVNLGNLELSPVVSRQIESEIRSVVLRALATLETTSSARLEPSLFGNFKGRTLGLWVDPAHPEQGSWGDTVALAFRKDGISPYITNNDALFLSKLASTKARGTEAIRISRTKDALNLEEIDGRGQVAARFVLRPNVDSKKAVRTVDIAIEDVDSHGRHSSLEPRDRAALAAIVDELSLIRDEQSGSPGVIYFWRGLLEAIGAGIECGAAVVEGGLNPLADVGCSIAVGLMVSNDDD